MKIRSIGIIIAITVCLAILGAFLIQQIRDLRYKKIIVWKEDFDSTSARGNPIIPEGWRLRRKLGTPPSVFSVVKDKGGELTFLHLEADKGSATLLYSFGSVDPKKTPILRWRWRVTTLPEGADGRIKSKDDQAIGIYLGTGGVLNNKSISYRWDTETPKGDEGNISYGKGAVKVKWYTLRNKEDIKNGRWYVEERNFAEDFKKAWGFYPKRFYLGISCNSQYTGTKAAADLDWIELVAASK